MIHLKLFARSAHNTRTVFGDPVVSPLIYPPKLEFSLRIRIFVGHA